MMQVSNSKPVLILRSIQFRLCVCVIALALFAAACSNTDKNEPFFGKTNPPTNHVLHYVTGSEVESLDPQVGTGQPDTRIYMALYEGLVEYGPKTTLPIPGVAEKWEHNKDWSEFVFHLRHDARWSNGDPITADDFVYSLQRGFSPEFAARAAYLGYYIKYAEAFNEKAVFVRDPNPDPQTGEYIYVLEKDVNSEAGNSETATERAPEGEDVSLDTKFHQFMHAPSRLILPGDEKDRAKAIDNDPKLKAAVAGKEFVPVEAKDIGVEPVNPYTLRITLSQPAPFFLKLLAHQFFRAVPKKAIEQYGTAWTQPDHIICSGAFKLKEWKPYDRVVVERNPYYWDKTEYWKESPTGQKVEQLVYYPVQDSSTVMNLYKAGEIDAFLNHTVPKAWLDMILQKKDYMDAPENAIDYFDFNCKKPPMTDPRVRKAFNLAIDKESFVKWRKITKLAPTFVPEGLFPGYPTPKAELFNPEKARQLLAEAGYRDSQGNYDPSKFPVAEVEVTYNPDGANGEISEWLQAQWKQNLKLTIPLKSLEFRTFLVSRPKGEYKGIARDGWVGDYMDPYTYLGLFSSGSGDNATQWTDPKYDQLLDEANRISDPQQRYEALAKAEAYLLDQQPFILLDIPKVNWMKKPYVKGMYPNPGTLHAWKFVYIETDPAHWDQSTPDMTEEIGLADWQKDQQTAKR
jgi:oligopeptide transport system substrate-binding protein